MSREDFVNPDLTEIVAILDRSGSMSSAISDTIGGYNEFIKKQKEVDGECRVTLTIFDDNINTLYEDMDIKEVEELTIDTFYARGMTRLNDAIGQTINRVGARLASKSFEERPGKVVVFISTDGMENHSREFNNGQVKDMVRRQTNDYSWEFIFSGADINSYEQGALFAIPALNTVNYDKSSKGTEALYGTVSAKVAQFRTGVTKSCAFTPEEKDQVESHVS
jgi:uncharacterized protein YegL